jgi:2-hydroxychromene-2-carboxylate isomerase
MTAPVDLYWSLRSPHSCLAVPWAQQLERDFEGEVRLRPVLLLAAREPAIAEPRGHDAEIEANQQTPAASGHWVMPTVVFAAEPFFGEDRIDTLRWRPGRRGIGRASGLGATVP